MNRIYDEIYPVILSKLFTQINATQFNKRHHQIQSPLILLNPHPLSSDRPTVPQGEREVWAPIDSMEKGILIK